MSEYNDISPRRRRVRAPEENESPANISENTAGTDLHDRLSDTAQSQGPYSRVPEEARRMSASPYGAVNAAAVRQSASRQDAFRSGMTVRQPARPAGGENARSPYQRPVNNTPDEPTSRVRVGYAPGQMSEARMNREPAGDYAGVREYPNARMAAPARPAPVRPAPARPVPGRTVPETPRGKEPVQQRHTLLHILASVLIAAGVFLAAVLMLPEDNGLRQQISSLARKVPGIRALADTEPVKQPETEPVVRSDTSPTVDQFASTDNLGALLGNVPAETNTSETEANENSGKAGQTGNTDAGDAGLPAVNAEDAALSAPDASATETIEFTPDRTGSALSEDAEPNPVLSDESGEDGVREDEPELAPVTGSDPDITVERLPEAEITADAEEMQEEGDPDDAEPEEEKEPEPLIAEAVPAASPDLITKHAVYSGKKTVKEYTRPAKNLIRMPSGWDYTRMQIGVLTFRGNAFRTNGAVGKVESADSLKVKWTAESGSIKGTTQTYYGTGWTGQPAIVKWSVEVRNNSNIYDKQKEKEGLKEVIIAGLDGNIRFLDLETGELSRNSIKLGYPMRGTPSVHPSGYPYMSVGQYAKNMKKGKTGTIGLRQYNMYSTDEIKLIDGTDKGLNRAYNTKSGSFETSALIDRVSETEVVVGSNGLLYLIDLNSEFDWNIGIYKSKQETVVMRSLTAAENKKKEYTAVESSPAMYNRYVFYADMGGILRCVDTNFLTPVWAVDTGDAVMAAVALDMPTAENVYLYTANMLKNRKSGNAQIRRFDAMNGKELWCTEIGVKKDTSKAKTDSGCKASPVIGENALSELVYFTVTGLSADGCSELHVAEETKAALVALEKETGKIRWAYALSDRSESSPIAVYDENGNGWIIQCAWDGSIVMLDGLTGAEAAKEQVEGNIEASPAAYNNMMVIGTTGKGTEMIYGLQIGREAE